MSDPTPIREHKTTAGRVYQTTEHHDVLIDWTPSEPVGGHRVLTRGVVRKHPTEGRVVTFFEQIKQGRKSQVISARVIGRPDLTELADICEKMVEEEARERKERKAEEARKAKEARAAKIAEFVATLPEGYTPLDRVDHNPNAADGWGLTEYYHGGRKLSWRDLEALDAKTLSINSYDLAVFVRADALASLLARMDAEKAAKLESRQVKEEARAAEERAKADQFGYDDLELKVIHRGSTPGEDGREPRTLVEIRSKSTGEALRFHDRNIFDFGRVVNPAYAALPGQEGGIARFDEATGKTYWDIWDAGSRELTAFEVRCLNYLYDHPQVETGIRM